MHSNVYEYLWGCNLSDILRHIVDNMMKAITFLIPVRMLIAESNYQNNISKSQGQAIGDVNFGKVYQVKLTYQLRYNQMLM